MNKNETESSSTHKRVQLDPMSEEQHLVYQYIKSGCNVIVDACAGSGKSTTILSIATFLPQYQFIQFTYNSTLCSEIKTKVESLGLENLSVYTFHSLVVKYYDTNGFTDTAIRRVLQRNVPPRYKIPSFQVLVIDEAQDMTFLYFKLIVKFCRDVGEPIQLLVLGDYMQGLYEFKGADTRFLTCADHIWKHFEKLSSQHFVKCTLQVSYRITRPMADFVNEVMLGEPRLIACKDGVPVVYLRRSIFHAERFVIHQITSLLKQGYSPSDFFILAGSVKGERSAVRRMENALVSENIPCHVPMFENDKIDERVIEGKVVFSTFHSVKGRQRKVVFIVGFDQSYFTYYARNLPTDQCPNTLYVGCTRATERLYVIERDEVYKDDRPLSFLKRTHKEMESEKSPYVEFKGIPQTHFYALPSIPGTEENNNDCIFQGRKLPTHRTTPTDLIKFIPESVLEEITPILESIFIKISNETETDNIDIPAVIQTRKGFHEDISDLNGIAIPMMFFDYLLSSQQHEGNIESNSSINNGRVLHSIIEQNMLDVRPNEHTYLKKIIRELPEYCYSTADYLYLSNVYVAVKEKLYFKLNQIDHYEWIPDSIREQCFDRMKKQLERECFVKDGRFSASLEKTLICQTDDEKHKIIDEVLIQYFPNELFRFTARSDLITDFCVWELKCTNSIVNDHLLQVVIYAWIWRLVIENIKELENIRDFRILNIKTGEILRLEATTQELTDIMIAILKGKYGELPPKEDDDFVNECKKYILDSQNYEKTVML
jgi:hypothetical protein